MNRLPICKMQKVNALIVNVDDGVCDAILNCATHACGGNYVVAVSTGRTEQAMQYAHSQKFDLSFVVLNNIIYQSLDAEGRKRDGLNLVTHLKQTCLAPVIALSGPNEDVSLPKAAVLAGASCFFWMPFPALDFMEEVRKCLSLGK